MTHAAPPTPSSWLRLLTAALLTVALTGCASMQPSLSEDGPPIQLTPPDAAAPTVPPVLSEADATLQIREHLSANAPPDLWQRLRTGFTMPDLDDSLVAQRENFYTRQPEYLQRMIDRSRFYLFHIVEEVEKRGMPTELALLPFVESAFNPQALSSAKASGMWQFMPATGRSFDLKQNVFRDDRRDVLASTRAALEYLERLHGMFKDWHLALAAYNWGEGNVRRAIARNQQQGRPTDYLSLRMPLETRHYVPKLQAIKNIVARPETFRVALPEVPNHPYFDSVPIERDIDVDLAVKLAGVTPELFRRLNPQMNKPVILAAGTEQILLPFDNAGVFRASLQTYEGPLASWTAWVAPSTMRPNQAAQAVGMEESELRQINHIPPRMLIKAGSTLLVARAPHRDEDVSPQLADHAVMALAPEFQPRGKKLRGAKARQLAKLGRGKERATRVAVLSRNSVKAAKPSKRAAAASRTRVASLKVAMR